MTEVEFVKCNREVTWISRQEAVCLYKSKGGRSIVNKSSVCLL